MKPNVIPMPSQQPDLAAELHQKATELGILFVHVADLALHRLQEAETAAVSRIAEFVPQERLLDLEEAAAYLKFKPRTLAAWSSGSHPQVRFTMLGGCKRFRKQWLDEFVDRNAAKLRKQESI